MRKFKLPIVIADLIAAQEKLRDHYQETLIAQNSSATLAFTLDGKLVGDIGEALAVELFGIHLLETGSSEGYDGLAPDGITTVQVKATGTNRGPAFRNTQTVADHLLFFDLDFGNLIGEVIYNGPERPVRELLGSFTGQRMVTRNKIREADKEVSMKHRLLRLNL